MNFRSHKICRQYLNLEFNGPESEGVLLQRTLPDLCDHLLLPAIEKAMDRSCPQESYLTIDRLEIDAGSMKLDQLDRQLPEMVAAALEKYLQNLQPGDFLSNVVSSANVQHRTVPQAIIDAFIFFLKHGTLPWSFHLPSGSGFEDLISASLREQGGRGAAFEQLKNELLETLTSPTARKRLVQQFTPSFLEKLLLQLSTEDKEVLDDILRRFRSKHGASAGSAQREKALWEELFASVSSAIHLGKEGSIAMTEKHESVAAEESIGKAFIFYLKHGTLPLSFHLPAGSGFEELVPAFFSEGDTLELLKNELLETLLSATARMRLVRQFSPAFLESLLFKLSAERKSVLDDVIRQLRSSNGASGERDDREEELWELLFATLASGKPLTAENVTAEKSKKWAPAPSLTADVSVKVSSSEAQVNPESTEASGNQPAMHRNIRTQQEPDQLSGIEHPDAESGIYIELAGLVLLHPFLPQLFSALGIADDEKLLQPSRALTLLYYLATGLFDAPEYELVLPKILCGISLDRVVESDITLSTSELEEASVLLTAVIRHWDVLKNTGHEGLRETFFKRAGKLARHGGEWLLQVESKSCDILLEQLPWGISMIQLPWMTGMLRVEWV